MRWPIVLLFLAFPAVTKGQGSLGDILRKEGLKYIRDLNKGDVSVKDNGCQCIHQNYDCGCCAHIKWEKVGLDDTACVNVTYLPDQYGISVLLTWDDKTMFNETISARNPPPLCAGIPHVKLLDVCIAFYDLDVKNKTFHGCVKLEADVAHFDIEDYELGCFNIPFSKKKAMQLMTEIQLQQHQKAFKEFIAAIENKKAKFNRI